MPRWLMLETGAVDLVRGELMRDGQVVRLSTRERLLLEYLAERPGETVSRDELLVRVWEHATDSLSRAVDKTMNRLRRKVERDPAQPVHLITAYGAGYRLVPLGSSGGARPRLPPADLDALVGRADLLASLEQHLGAGTRLLTLHGPGGVGKSRLARHLARSRSETVVWLGCGGLPTVGELWTTLAACHGVQLQGTGPEELGRALSHAGALLLVLDEVEHLADVLGPSLRAWLQGAPELCVVLTTRRPIGVAGERVVRVPPLPPAQARALFCLRAGAAEPGSVPDDGLMALLGGLPLAIEVAAARREVLEAAGAADALEPTLLLGLDAPSRARHTLQAVLDRSWQLLDPQQQRDLVAVSVCPAPFGHDLAVALLGGAPAAATRRLAQLLDHALLRCTPRGTGRRLHLDALVRSLVRARADEDPVLGGVFETACGVHAEHVLARGERALREGARAASPALLRGLADDHEHIAAVLRRSRDRAPVRAARAALLFHPGSVLLAPTATVAARVSLAVDQAERSGDTALLARALCWRLRVQHGRRDHDSACDTLARLLALPGVGPLVRARACRLALVSAARARNSAQVSALGAQARALLAEVPARHGDERETERLWLRDALAFAEQLRGGPGAGQSALVTLAQDARRHGDRVVLALILVHQGIGLARARRHAEARDLYAEAIACSTWLGVPGVAAIQEANAAVNLQVMGARDEAETAFRAVIRKLGRTGLESHTIAPSINLGNLLRDAGRVEAHEEAETHYRRAVALARRWNHHQHLVMALSELAQLHWMRGELPAAAAELAEACSRAAEVPGPPGLPRLMELQHACFLADQGAVARAEELLARPGVPDTAWGRTARACAQAWCRLARARRAGGAAGAPGLAAVKAEVAALPLEAPDMRSWLDHLRRGAGLEPVPR